LAEQVTFAARVKPHRITLFASRNRLGIRRNATLTSPTEGCMKTRARLLIATILGAVVLTVAPSWSAPARPTMMCSDGFEALCYVIGTSCNALDTVDGKILKKDLINCQLG
jgi:hypothetical protein